jgi:DNA repair protein RadC
VAYGPLRAGSRLQAAAELVRRSLFEQVQRRDAMTSPAEVRAYLRMTLVGRDHEVFLVLFLNSQHHVLACEEMFRGTLDQTAVYPREVVKRCLMLNASAVILAHNHPSGVPEPSRADEVLTKTLKNALSLIDTRVLDHFIVARDGVVSLAERGLV